MPDPHDPLNDGHCPLCARPLWRCDGPATRGNDAASRECINLACARAARLVEALRGLVEATEGIARGNPCLLSYEALRDARTAALAALEETHGK